MKTDDHSVANSQLRAHGIEGLRVVAASVMPTLVHCNTNASAITTAERAADLFRARTVDPELATSR